MSADKRIGAPRRLKDDVLFELSASYNVAQFASFAPDFQGRHQRILGVEETVPANLRDSIEKLFARAPERSLNVRTFRPDNPQTTGFRYGCTSQDEVEAAVRGFAAEGLFTIVNETVDVNDGGVSGVAHGDLVEFAPGDTPRCVEKPGVASLPRLWAEAMLSTVYGFDPPFRGVDPEIRLEFSMHPLRRGFRHGHTLVWEAAREDARHAVAEPHWPNRFSRHVGDKVFGLLVAEAAGLPVPRTIVIPRRIAPFSFGRDTGCSEVWLRTAPNEQTPGKFTTCRGWTDPYALLAKEDPSGELLASVICQAGVDARWSGACITGKDGSVFIEGVAGFGDGFMQGTNLAKSLPENVEAAVRAIYNEAFAALGAVRFEWVFDGWDVWVVQLHRGATLSTAKAVVDGEAEIWHDFDVSAGLEALRDLVARLDPARDGLRLLGRVGLTSHIADVIRKRGIPAVIAG